MHPSRSFTTPGSIQPCDNWLAGAAPDAFATLVSDLDAGISRVAAGDWPAAATAALRAVDRHIAKPDLLDGMRYVMRYAGYSRVLLHSDPAGRYCLLGLIWPPQGITPIHAHVAWCALGVHNGTLEEETYVAWSDGETAPGALVSTRALRPGQACCDASDGRFVHRLANRSAGFAMSLHVYGVPADRIADGVNRILRE